MQADSLISVIIETTRDNYELITTLVESLGGIVNKEYDNSWFTLVKLSARKRGIAILWLHSISDYRDYWDIGDIVKV